MCVAPCTDCVTCNTDSWADSFILPCTYGECTFSKNDVGVLSRAGSCSTVTGELRLDRRGIQSLSVDVFDGLAGVGFLHLSGNPLTSLPVGVFSRLTNLRELYMTQIRLMTSLPVGVFGGLSTLTLLDLSWNQLTNLPVGVFNGLSAVTTIRLGMGNLETLPAGVFNGLSAVINLHLANNKLSTLPEDVFDGLTVTVQTLDLRSNKLTSLPATVFDRLTGVRFLYLSSNTLSSLPATVFDKLTDMWTLDLSYNGLSNLPVGVFDKTTALYSLSLAGPGLTSLPAGVFDKLTGLHTLTLHGNALMGLSPTVFDKNTFLSELYLWCGGPIYCSQAGNTELTCVPRWNGQRTWRYAGPAHTCAVCDAGKYGLVTCSNCETGTYSAAVGATSDSTCAACPANTNSPAGSISITACTTACIAGSSGPVGGCTECVAGKFKIASGSAACTSCVAGKYSSTVGAAANICQACPPNSNAPAASDEPTDCQCNADWTGPDGGTTCSPCPTNSNSVAGSTTSTACRCKVGFSGPNGGTCAACPSSTFKSTKGSSSCASCPLNSDSIDTRGDSTGASTCYCIPGYFGDGITSCAACGMHSSSLTGSTKAIACYCKAGYFGNATESCTACAAGKYRVPISTLTCSGSCPCEPSVGQLSGTFSDGPGNTVANQNCQWLIASAVDIIVRFPFFNMPNPASWGNWDFVYINRCESADCASPTEVAKLSRAGVSESTRYSSSTGFLQVVLQVSNIAGMSSSFPNNPGFEAVWSVYELEPGCTLCPPGAYADASASSTCASCLAGTFQEMPGSTACTSCVAGKYLSTVGAAASNCQECPINSNALAASNEKADCTCNAGWTGLDGGTCSGCVPGTYKDMAGTSACNECAQGKYSTTVGALACDECLGGKYLDSSGNDAEADCKTCPANSGNNLVASAAESDCKCDPGSAGANGGPMCVLCAEGKYQANKGETGCDLCTSGKYLDSSGNYAEGDCKACPANSGNNPVASTVKETCMCDPGSVGPSGGPTCTLCAEGKYQASFGKTGCNECASGKYLDATGQDDETDCTDCPTNSGNNPAASMAESDCKCNAGSSGPDGGMRCDSFVCDMPHSHLA